MDKLNNYLKSIFLDEQSNFAKSCGTTIGYIRKVLSSKGSLFFGPVICRKLEENSFGAIDRKELRPPGMSTGQN